MTRPLTVFLPVDESLAAGLASALRGDPTGWLPRVAADGDDRWRIEVSLGPFHHEVLCRVGSVRESRSVIARSLDWWPRGHQDSKRSIDHLLPRFHGELLMHPVRLVLVLHGDYEVPGGRLGELVDSAALGMLARRTGSALLADIAGHGLPVAGGAEGPPILMSQGPVEGGTRSYGSSASPRTATLQADGEGTQHALPEPHRR